MPSKKDSLRVSEARIAPISAPPFQYHWSFCVAPKKRYVLAESLDPGVLILENQGPGKLIVETKYCEPIQLAPGGVRILRVIDAVFVDCVDELSSCVEFEFIPAPK